MPGPNIDAKTGGQLNIDVLHAKIHEKKAYTVSHRFASVLAGAYATLLLVNGSEDELHVTFSAASEGKAIAFLLAGVTASTDGEAIPAYNKHGSGGTYPNAQFYAGGTVANTGVARFVGLIAGGEGNKTVGGDISERNEWIIDPNQTFIAALQNTAGATKEMNIGMTFYTIKE